MAVILDLVRLFVGVTLLSFAATTDWLWRRAPNALWSTMAAVGIVLLAAEAALDWPLFLSRWQYLLVIPVFAGVIYGFWWLGLIAGGADAKALMALGLLLPYPLALADTLPLVRDPLPGSFSVLGNSLVVFMVIPLSLAIWNVTRRDVRFPHALLGVKRRAADVRRGHAWPMEFVEEDGSRRTRFFASRLTEGEIDDAFARIQALGEERVWVSPKIPFMIPLLAGFLLAFTLGDIMLALVSRVVAP